MTSPMSRVIQHLRITLDDQLSQATDAQLLERFIVGRDAPALELIVRRHGVMVWGVCRRLLSDLHDAEDAFQATFLVLVRRADSIVPRELVGNWLYGVAQQTALKARATKAKRTGRERQVPNMPDSAETDRQTWDDLRPMLDDELARLPAKYRSVFVSGDLEGKTRQEMARELNLPEGTVASRLSRARAMLAERLRTRGVTLSAAALTTLLATNAASASVPPLLLSTTLQAVGLAASGEAVAGVVSASVLQLADVMAKSALSAKSKTMLVVFLGVCLLTGVAGAAMLSTPAAKEPSTQRIAESRMPTDGERLAGAWRATRVVIRGEVVEFGEGKGPTYSFAEKVVTVLQPFEADEPNRPGRPGPRGPGMLADANGPRLREAFGERGGPWAGIDAEQRLLLRSRLTLDENGTRIDFGVRLDERERTIDRTLAVEGVEKLIVRGVYSIEEDRLRIWESAPMQDRPTARQIEKGDCLAWVFVRKQ